MILSAVYYYASFIMETDWKWSKIWSSLPFFSICLLLITREDKLTVVQKLGESEWLKERRDQGIGRITFWLETGRRGEDPATVAKVRTIVARSPITRNFILCFFGYCAEMARMFKWVVLELRAWDNNNTLFLSNRLLSKFFLVFDLDDFILIIILFLFLGFPPCCLL